MQKDEIRQVILNCEVEAGDFSVGGEASSKLKSLLHKLGIPAQTIRRIAIATYELEINIIIHTYGGRLKADVTPSEIRVIASDKGPGIADLEKAFQPGYSTASQKAREMGFGAGMGLCNIKRYSDELHVETEVGKGTEIEARIYLRESGDSSE
ncbi:anti-sigma regulatory factor [Orenia metallireducens]|uniref:Anti-sigma regulatory factor n=1 Tax=Orenia metallireducens TaxID=1413210 RepID=A0A1C0A567_9FIRM|nr:anti-sigma regulatory factor [Orenia metallireducens]OCL25284.1 anti-sigma regulatory factor [Orenia metallireducens]